MRGRTHLARSLRPPIRCDRKVETLVRQLAVFLSGVATTLTGVFIRSCKNSIEMNLANA